MMESEAGPAEPSQGASEPGRSGLKLFATVFFAVLLALLVGAAAIKYWFFPSAFEPVRLQPAEQTLLNQKLHQLGYQEDAFVTETSKASRLEPQPYSEEGASREVRLSERELNGLLAKNTELATKLAIDLSDRLASARLVLPLDPDLPLLGGQTLRLNAGLEMAFENQRPLIKLRGISVWGVPIPNAWLGNLKNVDLVAEFGEQGGFWSSFAAGIDEIKVEDGQLLIRLRE